jgi:hypothetical protein
MKKVLTMLFNAVIALTMTSCSADDIVSEQATNNKPSITIEVNQSKAITRAAYDGLDVFVTKGDVIGVYAVDKAGNIVSDNVAFTYDGKAWNAAADVPYDKSYSYYAYYPHVENPYKPDFSKKTTNEIFAQFISDTDNKFQKDDQTTLEKFTACDLMVSEPGVLSGKSTVSFSLYHKKALAILTGEGAPFTSGTYIKGDKAYFMMKPSTPTTVAGNIMQAESGKAICKEVPYNEKAAKKKHYTSQYLTFIPIENTAFGFTDDGLSYSLDDGKTWTELAAKGTTPTVAAGEKILWKNNKELSRHPSEVDQPSYYGYFTSTGRFNVQGNIMSLHFGDNFANQTNLSEKESAYTWLFKSTKVVNAENLILPATTLGRGCYSSMFQYCTSLTNAPTLPATTLANSCYDSMFQDCTSLTKASELPATELARSCYNSMFKGCTSLTKAPELHATTLAQYCYYQMFKGCTALNYVKMLATDYNQWSLYNWLDGVAVSGTFIKAEGVEIPNSASGIPEGWNVETYNP